MGTSLGKNAVVQMNAVAITTWVNQADLQRVVDLLDAHTFGDTAKEYAPGLVDGTLGVTCLYDDVAGNIDAAANTAFTAAAGVVVNIYPVGTAVGKAYYTGTAFMRNERLGVNVAQLETLSFDLQFSGGISRALVV